jgi:signal transduction histidine kinase
MSQRFPQPVVSDWRAALEAAPDPYLILSPDLRIVAASDAYLRATMTQRDAILGRDLLDVFPDDPADPAATGGSNLRASLLQVLESKAPHRVAAQKYPIRKPASEGGAFEPRIWQWLNAPVLSSDGSVVALIHRAEDVTEREAELSALQEARRTAQALGDTEHQREEAERVSLRARDQRAQEFQQRLIGIVGHDLRNPLSAIATSATLLGRGETSPERTKRISQILNSAARMDSIIANLLDYTRVRTGTGLQMVRKRIDAHELCRQTVRELQVSHPDRVIVVQADGDGMGDWDPDRLGQIVSNLVSNAVKYGAPPEPIIVVSWGEKKIWTLQVSNRGNPIPADLLPKLFEPFERGPQTDQTVKQSMGLGLYIVSEVVRAHGGTLSVSSTPGHKTVFTARLPRYEDPRQEGT